MGKFHDFSELNLVVSKLAITWTFQSCYEINKSYCGKHLARSLVEKKKVFFLIRSRLYLFALTSLHSTGSLTIFESLDHWFTIVWEVVFWCKQLKLFILWVLSLLLWFFSHVYLFTLSESPFQWYCWDPRNWWKLHGLVRIFWENTVQENPTDLVCFSLRSINKCVSGILSHFCCFQNFKPLGRCHRELLAFFNRFFFFFGGRGGGGELFKRRFSESFFQLKLKFKCVKITHDFQLFNICLTYVLS